jgi:hypothetical protein
MYRCYLIHHGRIAAAEELAAVTLPEAIQMGHALLRTHPDTTSSSGIEIWQKACLLYSDQCHTEDTGIAADVVSPFLTAESVMLPTWRPSRPGFLSLLTFPLNVAAKFLAAFPLIRNP